MSKRRAFGAARRGAAHAAGVQAPQPRTVWSMVTADADFPVLSTGCSQIDSCIGGGIRAGGITDVCGEASAGKSQFCMQLALQSLLPTTSGGLDDGSGTGTCLYISTEGRFPSKRFVQIATHFRRKHQATFDEVEKKADRLLDRVLLSELFEPEEFWPFVRKDLPVLVNVRNVRMIIVDSIAGICRGEMANSREGILLRSKWLCAFSTLLREIASQKRAVVVTVNQVSAIFEKDNSSLDLTQHRALYPFPPQVAHVSVTALWIVRLSGSFTVASRCVAGETSTWTALVHVREFKTHASSVESFTPRRLDRCARQTS